MVKEATFKLCAGEIVGLFGLMGAGRTELAQLLFGLEPMDTGEVIIGDDRFTSLTPQLCIEHGMAFVTEDRRLEGLLMSKSVHQNLILAVMRSFSRSLGMMSNRRENEIASQAVRDLNIKTVNKDTQPVRNLSGGNQQKVVIGKWLVTNPSIFIMDEPTRGVDVGAKYEIYTIINDMAKNGATILLISSEMQELIGMCDRILVMHKGCLTGDIPKSQYDQETIMQFALSGGA